MSFFSRFLLGKADAPAVAVEAETDYVPSPEGVHAVEGLELREVADELVPGLRDLAQHPDFPLRGSQESEEDFQECAFPRPVRPEDGDELALGQIGNSCSRWIVLVPETDRDLLQADTNLSLIGRMAHTSSLD